MGIEESLRLIRNLAESFELRLDDVKINREAPSGNFYRFSKFYASSFLNVRLGFEEASVRLRNPFSKELVEEIIERLVKILPDDSFHHVKVNMRSHLETEGDMDSFLESLVPKIPNDFQERLQGRGVFYTLGYPEKNLRTSISISKSLFFEKSLFLSIDCDFTPCSFNIGDAAIAVGQE